MPLHVLQPHSIHHDLSVVALLRAHLRIFAQNHQHLTHPPRQNTIKHKCSLKFRFQISSINSVKKVNNHIAESTLLSSVQHGFQSKNFTLTNLIWRKILF